MSHVIFNPRTFTSNLTHNLEYFFVGRHTGLLGYFFPAMFAMGAFLLAPRRRPWWQWLVLRVGTASGARVHHRDAVHLARRRSG